MKKHIALAAVYASCASLVNAASVTIDFNLPGLVAGGTGGSPTGINIGTPNVGADNDLDAGNPSRVQPYESIYSTLGVGIGGITFTDPTNLLTLYNSDGSGGLDDDLESENFVGGNATSRTFGNVLIHQTNLDPRATASVNNVSTPNDDRDGGNLVIFSDLPLTEFSFSYLDLDEVANDADIPSTITFTDTVGNESVTINFADLEGASSSDFRTPGVDFGDHNANDVGAITLAELQRVNSALTQFNEITIFTTGSGGLAEFSVETLVVPVPEPSSSLLIALGALSFTLRRRR